MTDTLNPIVRVVDDDVRVRESEAFILRLDGWMVQEFESAADFLEKDDPDRPGCLVLDIRMPGMSGLELQEVLRRQKRTVPILFLTGHGDIESTVMALKRGAADFVRKPMNPDDLQSAVRRLVDWHVRLCLRMKKQQELLRLHDSLTDKEKIICRMVARGALSKQIAIDLSISEQTVKTHRSNLTHKLGLRSAVELADFLRQIDEPIETTFRIAVEATDHD